MTQTRQETGANGDTIEAKGKIIVSHGKTFVSCTGILRAPSKLTVILEWRNICVGTVVITGIFLIKTWAG